MEEGVGVGRCVGDEERGGEIVDGGGGGVVDNKDALSSLRFSL